LEPFQLYSINSITMRFSIAALTLGAAGAMAGVVTETLTEYTTFCPEATSVVHGSKTYSISTVCLPCQQVCDTY
jgi:hypothetical protein